MYVAAVQHRYFDRRRAYTFSLCRVQCARIWMMCSLSHWAPNPVPTSNVHYNPKTIATQTPWFCSYLGLNSVDCKLQYLFNVQTVTKWSAFVREEKEENLTLEINSRERYCQDLESWILVIKASTDGFERISSSAIFYEFVSHKRQTF